MNLDDRDAYYYKRVYVGCVRAVDFLSAMPECNGNIGVYGSSQGGALAIITAALDARIKALVSIHPALCDLTGYLHGRAGGWPHLFKDQNINDPKLKDKIATCAYYDVVNFARQLQVPGFYTFGFNDMVCAPTTTYAAYNQIDAPKILLLAEDTAHFGYPEQWGNSWDWLIDFLKSI
jgi:cephalosporin-C deacetylase-like acetyl esterase